MRYLIASSVLLIVTSLTGWVVVRRAAEPAASAPLPPWYECGTLQDATYAEWMAASEEDRVATCAGFIVEYTEREGKPPPRPESLRRKATALAKMLGRSLAYHPRHGGARAQAFRPCLAGNHPPLDTYAGLAYHIHPAG